MIKFYNQSYRKLWLSLISFGLATTARSKTSNRV